MKKPPKKTRRMIKEYLKDLDAGEVPIHYPVADMLSRELLHTLKKENEMTNLIMIQGFINDVQSYYALPNRFYKQKRVYADAIVMQSKYVLKIVKDFVESLPPVKFVRYGELTANAKKQ